MSPGRRPAHYRDSGADPRREARPHAAGPKAAQGAPDTRLPDRSPALHRGLPSPIWRCGDLQHPVRLPVRDGVRAGPRQAGVPGAPRSASGRRGECGPRSGARRAVGSAPRRRRAPSRAAAHAPGLSRPAHPGLRVGDPVGHGRRDRLLARGRDLLASSLDAGDNAGGNRAGGLRRHRRAQAIRVQAADTRDAGPVSNRFPMLLFVLSGQRFGGAWRHRAFRGAAAGAR